ncbi:SRPBCC family protein [Chitiniphilus purpureus]|uniref:SRPBCC family protein n=1 Tax=Chitiniphilus purpureus TaxID=2981137 RepID=A0ABY6DNM5_9NEIS|nr:SRPBCC family protein [Chitiniphilus sp. CD1]UXY15086.1 SRPBCC family protein [Chitiniphilus sp. CD1]
MTKPSFIYVIYIATTPEKLWEALLDPETTKRYWCRQCNVSDWQPGSRWEHRDYDHPERLNLVGSVLESDPPRRLVLSWADPEHADNPDKVSRVTFELKPHAHEVKLTVRHEELEADSPMLRGISDGWPAILSSLKTLLETGEPLPLTAHHWNDELACTRDGATSEPAQG